MRNSIWVLELLVIWQLPTGTVPCKNIRFSQIYLPFSPCIFVNHYSNEMGGGGLLPRPGAWFKRAQPSRSVCVCVGGGGGGQRGT